MMDELILEGNVNIDLKDGIPIPINLSIADAKDPKSRDRSFSKDIAIPLTANNAAYFKSAFNIHVTDSAVNFDTTKRVGAQILKKGVPVLTDGVLRLKSVSIGGGRKEIIVNVFSETADYFLSLQNIKLGELDWSQYDHVLSRANIQTSWTAPTGSGYVYPLIERGNGRTGVIWNTTDIVPYVYIKECIEKIFDFLGVPIDSNWMKSDLIKSALFGYGGGDYVEASLTQQEIDDRLVDLDNGALTFSESGVVNWGVEFVPGSGFVPSTEALKIFSFFSINDSNTTFTTTSDNYLQYNDGVITVQKSGNYSLNLQGSIQVALTMGALTHINNEPTNLQILKNGSVLTTNVIPATFNNPETFNINITQQINAQVGDEISIRYGNTRVYVTRPDEFTDNPITLDITTTTPLELTFETTDTAVTDGSTVSLSKFIPDIKCSDFLIGCIRQFNLYLSEPDINGEVRIEPLSNFYQATNKFDDISTEIDENKEFKIVPSANEYKKTLTWKFKQNKDFDNTVYIEKWDEPYGDYSFDQSSYYAKGEQKIEVPWSTIIPYEIDNGILVPRFITIDNGGNVKQNKGAPRIMFYNGLKDGNWIFRNTDTPAQQDNLTQYPCIHHFDDWENPTFDMNFKLVNEVFYVATTVTTVNVYSEYYSEFINEMTSPAGRIVTAYVKWSSTTVKNKEFSKRQMINGSLFRLNKIFDFDENIAPSTKIELIKTVEAKKRKAITLIVPPKDPTLTYGGGGNPNESPNGNGSGNGAIGGGFNEVNPNTNILRG